MSMTDLSCAVIIRFHYKRNDRRFEWRFHYFAGMVLPRLLNQADADFDIAVWCEPCHASRFRKLSPRIKTFTAKVNGIKAGYEAKVAAGYHVDFVDFKNVRGLGEYDIQVAIDSDDIILKPDFIDVVKGAFRNCKESAHMSFPLYAFDYKSLRVYDAQSVFRYSAEKCSAVYAIFQPDKTDYKFAYCESHLIIGKLFARRLFGAVGFAAYSAHDINESSCIPAKAIPVIAG